MELGETPIPSSQQAACFRAAPEYECHFLFPMVVEESAWQFSAITSMSASCVV